MSECASLCPGRDSNPHGNFFPRDFKFDSLPRASDTIRHDARKIKEYGRLQPSYSACHAPRVSCAGEQQGDSQGAASNRRTRPN